MSYNMQVDALQAQCSWLSVFLDIVKYNFCRQNHGPRNDIDRGRDSRPAAIYHNLRVFPDVKKLVCVNGREV